MLQIETQSHKFSLEQGQDGQLLLNGEPQLFDFIRINNHQYHAIYQQKSFLIEVMEAEKATKKYKIKVNGEIFDLKAFDKIDLLLKKMGLHEANTATTNEVAAPMPGKILQVICEPGTAVKQGDKLMVLEAMKMENIIKSPVDGVVKSVSVAEGQNVEKKQVLVTFE